MNRNGNATWMWFKYAVGAVAVAYTIFNVRVAEAVSKKPGVFSKGTADTSKIDSSFTAIIELCIFIAAGGGAVACAIGLVMMLPVIGKAEKAWPIIKGGAYVILFAGVFYSALAFWGKLFL